MQLNDIARLEKALLVVLKQEYSFYQSLYILLDKQRDLIKYNKDEHLLDLFTEVERCHQRIKKSEEKIAAIKAANPNIFQAAAVLPQVKKLTNSIATLVKKNITLVTECEEYVEDRYKRIKSEMGELQNSRKILQYLSDAPPAPQFVDGKQ